VIEGIDFMPEPSYATSTRWLSCVTLDPARISAHRDDIMRACEEVDIEVRPLWMPMHLQPVFAGARFVGPGLCAELFETGLCLPSGSGMTDEDQSRVIDVVIDVLKT
jgi:dTDP-4-amino-4,6-dideoxygalactose transaminase